MALGATQRLNTRGRKRTINSSTKSKSKNGIKSKINPMKMIKLASIGIAAGYAINVASQIFSVVNSGMSAIMGG